MTKTLAKMKRRAGRENEGKGGRKTRIQNTKLYLLSVVFEQVIYDQASTAQVPTVNVVPSCYHRRATL